MTFLETWIRTPFSLAIAWTIFHSLWQGLIAAALLAAGLSVVRSARSRYAVACLAMLGVVLPFGATFVYYAPWTEVSQAVVSPIGTSPPDIFPVPKVQPEPSPLRFEVVLPWAVPFWFAGVLICTLRHMAGWIASRRLRRKGVCSAPGFWQGRLTALGTSLRVSTPVTLLESCFAEVPVVIGHVRPVVLLPVGLIAGLPTLQIEALLLHELAHIRRCDYLINLFQRFVECVLFYHPAVWWISGVIREERENCCDDVVVAMNGDAKEYATALTALERHRAHAPQGVPAATGGSLVKRIRRMLCPTEGVNTAVTPVLLSAILVTTAIIGVAGLQHPTSAAAPAPAIVTRAISAERPLAQANNIQASASAIVAPIVFSPKWINPGTKSILSPQERSFQKWLDEDALYIITEEERVAFNALGTDEEREHFIQQFWLRRDPTPSTAVNEFREEHYRRIAYANQRFGTASGRPGWATDRGAFLIIYGRPDELESHNVASGGRGPFELWLYRYIDGKGANVIFEFADITGTGDFRLVGPKPGAAAERVPQQLNARIEDVWVADNRRIPTQTIRARLQTKPGNEFDQGVIAKDVNALMSLGLFEEVSVGLGSGPNGGPSVTFKVREAPLVRTIEYKGLRSVTIAEIDRKLREAKVGLVIDAPYFVEKATKAADVLKALIASKGFNAFTLEVATEPVPPNAVRVIFVVNERTGQ